ncbi:MAG TPA: HAD-IB family hydrolase [Actinomycetota bacterium]|nr:HAD-IB family hydrolase [Actinomycetota bacterium]
MGKRAAFFDCDKTLIPGSSLYLLARGMYERDFIRVRQIAGFAWGQLRYQLFGKELMNKVGDIQESALQFVKGRHQDELRSLGREIAEEHILPRVYEDIARIIEQHMSEGTETWLLTAAPQELADVIAQGLGMTGAMGTVSELDDAGIYTGQLAGPLLHGPEKAKAVERLALERDLDLTISDAYSDSKNDLPLLESVGHPHAVNPDPELKRIARARGWPIQDLRARRRALLIGVPSTLGAVTIFGAGVAVGTYLSRRKDSR